MCLLTMSYNMRSDYPLIIAANRDEFFERPTEPLHIWENSPIIAGKDVKLGGTWMGVTKAGRFALVTNVRNPFEKPGDLSRGFIVKEALEADDLETYLEELHQNSGRYSGYNLLAGSVEGVYYHSNQSSRKPERLERGLYGLSNAALNTPWPKVEELKSGVGEAASRSEISKEELFTCLSSERKYKPSDLPDTGVGKELEQNLSSVFIKMKEYGTRSQTILLIDNKGGVEITERLVNNDANGAEDRTISFRSENIHQN